MRAAPRERASFRPYLAVDCPPAESVCASMALLEHEGRPAPPRRRCAPHVLCAGAGLRCGAHRAPWARPLRACRWRACSRLLSLPHRQGEATMALASAGHGAACLCAELRLHPVFERFEHSSVRIGPLKQAASACCSTTHTPCQCHCQTETHVSPHLQGVGGRVIQGPCPHPASGVAHCPSGAAHNEAHCPT